ncbi:hypothetical protein [Altibacter lentus]|uniref:hypothetical protein n=1 Tax=Altibacter lentus TaxID=1223410 RepID=UPI000556A31E|nr:hypothetical protein [Altibacter lentus]
MALSNDIVLRPRFRRRLPHTSEVVLLAFEEARLAATQFIISRVDDHVFIRIPKHKQHFWSPQLHLEVRPVSEKESELFGLFGPNPTVWTLFMFLHFGVATLFIGFGIWAYSNYVLDTPYGIQLGVMGLLIALWVILYFAGKMGKTAGSNEMQALHAFMEEVLAGEFK